MRKYQQGAWGVVEGVGGVIAFQAEGTAYAKVQRLGAFGLAEELRLPF